MRKVTLVSNSILSFLSELIPLLFAVFTIPPIIHGLGPARFGILSIIWVMIWYFGIFDLGLGRAATKFVSEAIGRGRMDAVPDLVWTAVIVQAAISMVGIGLVTWITPLLVCNVLKVSGELGHEAGTTFNIIAFMIPVVMITTTMKGVLEAAQRFDLVAYVKISASLSTYGLTLAGVWAGMKLPGIIWLLLCSRVVILLAHFYVANLVFPGLSRKISFAPSMLRSFFAFGGWATISTIAGPIYGYLERFVISYLLSVETLSYYAAPADMVSRLVIIPMSMSTVLFPAFSGVGLADKPRLMGMFCRPLKYLLLPMSALLVLLITFAHPILRIWLGQDFAAKSAPAFQILVCSLFFNAFALIPYTTVQGLGRPDLKAKLDLVALPLYGLLSIWFVSGYGLAGAASAKLIINSIDLCALLLFSSLIMDVPLSALLQVNLGRGIGISAAFMLCACAVSLLPVGIGLEVSLVCGLLILFTGVFWKLAMDEVDREALRSLVRLCQRRPVAM